MKIILAILLGLILVGCSQSNYAQKKTVISNMSDFLKVNEAVCSKYKSTDKKYMVVVHQLAKTLNYQKQRHYYKQSNSVG